MLKSKKSRILMILALIAMLSMSLVPLASAKDTQQCLGCVEFLNHCDIKAVSPDEIALGESFAVVYKGTLNAIRFRDADGIKGWMEPFATGTGGTSGPLGWFWYWFTSFFPPGTPFYDGVAFFTNQASAGGYIVEPGTYWVECFGPWGSTGNPQRVVLLGP